MAKVKSIIDEAAQIRLATELIRLDARSPGPGIRNPVVPRAAAEALQRVEAQVTTRRACCLSRPIGS